MKFGNHLAQRFFSEGFAEPADFEHRAVVLDGEGDFVAFETGPHPFGAEQVAGGDEMFDEGGVEDIAGFDLVCTERTETVFECRADQIDFFEF